MLPSSEELVYFYEVAHSLNISRAAMKLGISQPSLSLAMKRIETTIGTTLFVRHKNGITLLPAGKKLLSRVKILLQQWDDTRAHAIALHHQIQGNIVLGCPTTIALFIHHILGDLFETHPALSVHIKHATSQQITEQVSNAMIDIGIATNPYQHPDLIMRKLNATEMTFWQGLGERQIQNIASDRTVIFCNTDMPQSARLLNEWRKINPISTRIINVNSLETIANLTANNCGIGILPSCFIHSLYPGKLKRIPDAPSCFDDIFLIYRAEYKEVKSIQTVAQAIKNYMSNSKE